MKNVKLSAKNVTEELNRLQSDEKAKSAKRFFKTYKGSYGEEDVFIGVRVPEIRRIVKTYQGLPLKEIEELLKSSVHEHRLAAAIIMAEQAKRSDKTRQKVLHDFYLKHIRRINSWDIVDGSCRDVMGRYLENNPKEVLYRLAKSNNLWERRVAIVTTQRFIMNNNVQEAFKIAKLLLRDDEDLVHKAAGWTLREAGIKDEKALRIFLNEYASVMPRTMLRYATEHLPENTRKKYMTKNNNILFSGKD